MCMKKLFSLKQTAWNFYFGCWVVLGGTLSGCISVIQNHIAFNYCGDLHVIGFTKELILVSAPPIVAVHRYTPYRLPRCLSPERIVR